MQRGRTPPPLQLPTPPKTPPSSRPPSFRSSRSRSRSRASTSRRSENTVVFADLDKPLPPCPSVSRLPCYDQYGFIRVYQHVPHHEQEAIDAKYLYVCDRRSKKWDDWVDRHHGALPPRSDKLKRYIRKGIPHHLRASCWFHYSGAEAKWQKETELYTLLICREEQDLQSGYSKDDNEIFEHITVIDRDIYRTFPDNIKFRPRQTNIPQTAYPTPSSDRSFQNDSFDEQDIADSIFETESQASTPAPSKTSHLCIYHEQNPYLLSLRRILVAFAYYSWPHPNTARPSLRTCKYPIGYCQSLNFITAFLLLVFAFDDFDFESGDEQARLAVEERVFWMLVVIIEDLLPEEMYGNTLQGARVSQEVLWKYIIGKNGSKYGLEKMSKWLDAQDPLPHGKKLKPFGRLRKTKQPLPEASNSTPLSLITTQWFMTLFITILPPHPLLRLWDTFIYQGEKTLIRFTLTLLALHQSHITSLSLSDLSAWRYLKVLPHRCYDVGVCTEMYRGWHPRFGNGKSKVVKSDPTSPISPTEEGEERWDSVPLKKGVGSVSGKMVERYRSMVVKDMR